MKKASQYSLILVTCVFIVFLAGTFFGRNTNYHLLPRTSETEAAATIPEDLVIYSTEIYINGKLNINAAGKEDLTLLPGIGDILSDRIIAYREEYGKFQEINELLSVDGMGKSKLVKIKDYITVGGLK